MTATAATLRSGFAAARPPSSSISSITVRNLRIFMDVPLSVPASFRPLSLHHFGGARGGRRVTAAPDPDLSVDQYHGDAEEIAGPQRLERGAAHRAHRRVHDAAIRLAARG